MSQPQGAPPPSAASGVNRLRGHLGHLTQEESTALESFKAIAAKAGYYTPPTREKKASHDDGTLVRYLRARKFVPRDAFEQFKDTEIWRKDNDLEALYEKIDVEDYQEARSVYPQWTGRRDKRGIPVYLFEVGKLDSKKMIAYSSATSKSKVKGPSPSRMLRLFALYENLTRFVMPLCSSVPGRPNPETPVDQSNNIVDISHVGLKQFWNLRSHMQDASQLATAHYPETLDRIFIIGAPSFFPTVWGWIKKWFDPITTSKIFILSDKDVYPTLSAFIEPESIPRKYGGKLDFECGKLPLLDPPVKAALDLLGSEEMFLTAPVRWIDDENGEMMALGVGSVDGHSRKERMATLHSLARLTLTRSNTYQGQQAQSYPDTTQALNQASQWAAVNTLGQHLTPSSSRPQSRDQAKEALSLPDVEAPQSRPTPAEMTGLFDIASRTTSSQLEPQFQNQHRSAPLGPTETPAQTISSQPESHHQNEQVSSAPVTTETPAQPQPSLSAISDVTEQKPTMLSYRSDRPPQLNDTTSTSPPAQKIPPESTPLPTQSASVPQSSTASSQTTHTPTVAHPPAPLADRLNPHFTAPRSEPAQTLRSEAPHNEKAVNGKPKNLPMPERPNTLDRMETVYMTPPSDPSEIRDQFSR